MKKHIFSMISVLISLPSLIFAQTGIYSLSDYQLPVLERRALETNISLSGSQSHSETPDAQYGIINSGSLNNDLNVRYSHFRNNERLQQESRLVLNFRSDIQKNESKDLQNRKSSSLSPNVQYYSINRMYLARGNFLETDIFIEYDHYGNSSFQENHLDTTELKSKRRDNSIMLSVPLKIGKGRIEPVQDARHAIYIIDELQKRNCISGEWSTEEIQELAELISSLKNRRFFDSRLRRIAELEAIDSFLVAKNSLLRTDALYFATLGDFWDYGNQPLRYSGTRFSAVLLPGYYFSGYNRTEEGLIESSIKNNVNILHIDGGFELSHEKPINLFWQKSIDLHIYGGMLEGKRNSIEGVDPDYKIRIPSLRLGFDNAYGYYPNTRTNINFYYGLEYTRLFDKSDNANDIMGADRNVFTANAGFSMNYYFSPQLRLNASCSLEYIRQDSENTLNGNYLSGLYGNIYHILLNNANSSRYYGNFGISLIYSIF